RRLTYDRGRLAGGQPPHVHRALGLGFAVMAALPELRLALRELERGGTEELEVLREAMRVGEAGDDDEDGPRMDLEQLGDGERPGRSGQPGHAEADVSPGEPLGQVLERLPVPQHLDGLRYHGRRAARGSDAALRGGSALTSSPARDKTTVSPARSRDPRSSAAPRAAP